jgi:Tfp pilus assembly protein PilO
MNLITPLILIIISIGTFFMYIDPNYRGQNLSGGDKSIIALQAEDAQYQKALKDTDSIREKRQTLQDQLASFATSDLLRLEKLLPDNVDNIKLVIDMNQIAQNHALTLKNIKFDTTTKPSDKLGADTSKSGVVSMSFTVNSSYGNFQNFLSDLEKSLRLVDITDLVVSGNDTGLYDFSVGLKTYWLK